jgi:hypothetical protein
MALLNREPEKQVARRVAGGKRVVMAAQTLWPFTCGETYLMAALAYLWLALMVR